MIDACVGINGISDTSTLYFLHENVKDPIGIAHGLFMKMRKVQWVISKCIGMRDWPCILDDDEMITLTIKCIY